MANGNGTGSASPGTPKEKPAQLVARLMRQMQSMKPGSATLESFQDMCVQVSTLPLASRPDALLSTMSQTFGKSMAEVNGLLQVRSAQVDFDELVPKAGWIRDYVEWTRLTEPPTVFHFFTAAVILGTTLGRRVFFDKGAYQVFPNFCVMLIAPSGACRKTSCANLGIGIYNRAGGTTLADKTTPEGLVDAMEATPNVLIYGAELSVFLGKQKYNEGMIPLLTSLFDCPEEFRVKTIGRGETLLTNVALSALMCSTADWLQTGIPADSFKGGFMSRFLFVVQESTPRCFPVPPKMNADAKRELISRLAHLRSVKGEFSWTKDAAAWFDSWYRSRHNLTASGEKHFAGYFERKPDHIHRLAMILQAAADPKDLTLTASTLKHAERILTWLESSLPRTFDQLTSSAVGEDQIRIIRQLKQHGGSLEHSVLLRRNSSRLNAEQFKRAITTLREARILEWDAVSKSYLLTPEGWQ